ncbi:MAG: type I DNA topoisomerase [Cyclobacteriaceae bacterium]|nr:type I DNA topoisomerase [Cyclobacteriaceae bacterium]
MSNNLVIVESPAKAKTIEGYLGKDFKVVSSYGHVRDLPKDDMAIDIKNGFKPTYEVSKDKKNVIKELKSLLKGVDMVYLASDDDREGEAISWHLKEVLDLNDSNTRRIVFREITKNAIENALKSPRGIDINLVNAQQARRILDRLVGFELSPILWKKIKTGLSAGRVQSVAVRLVVEREREVEQFNSASYYKVVAEFLANGKSVFKADFGKKIETEEEASALLESLVGSVYSVKDLTKKPAKKSPAPPFTTSTLQQEASRKLGFSVSQTMSVAQKLYEAGKISYMRTDSLNLSQEAIQGAAQAIKSEYGDKFHKSRSFKTKNAGAQEAHEAVRPTNFALKTAGDDKNGQRLYELIWKRAIASQMADAELEKTTVTIATSRPDVEFVATGEVIRFEGFLKVYLESIDDDDSGVDTDSEQKGMLPKLDIGQQLELVQITARESFSRPPARYTEASLVKKLEEMGIGRPSTYAPTISTILKRGYVVKESREGKTRNYTQLTLKADKFQKDELQEGFGAEKKKLFPTNIAMVVNDFLVEHFPNVTNFSFTADVEKEFDEIANGKMAWDTMIDNFYGKFHTRVEETTNIERASIKTSRVLGVDPKTGKQVITRMGRFGPLVQIGEISEDENDEKPKFAGLRSDQLMENITLEDALELFKLPRTLGEYEEKVVVAGIGRFGPFIRHDSKFISITGEDDPHSIELDRAIEMIKEKREKDANMLIIDFEGTDIQVLNGRYGPYIKAGKKNVKIPKGKKPEELTLEECKELAAAAPEKKKFTKKK